MGRHEPIFSGLEHIPVLDASAEVDVAGGASGFEAVTLTNIRSRDVAPATKKGRKAARSVSGRVTSAAVRNAVRWACRQFSRTLTRTGMQARLQRKFSEMYVLLRRARR